MSALISIDRSLVLRCGHITYQFNRYLDNRTKIQLENQTTGEYKEYSLSKFYSDLQNQVLVPILSDESATLLDQSGAPKAVTLDLSSLSPEAKAEIDFRMGCIKYLRRKKIRRGQRTQIAKAIENYFSALEKKNTSEGKSTPDRPSTSTVMSWIRRYEQSGCNAASLLSGNNFRRRPTELATLVEEAMEWALDTHYLTSKRLTLTFAFERLGERLQKLVAEKKLAAKDAIVSMATFQRRKDDLDPYMVTARRYSKNAANHAYRATFDGTTVKRAMARLEIDHCLLNWVVICDRTGLPLGRPTLTIVIDSYSGYVVGLYVSFNGPSVTAVINVIKNSIRPKDDLVVAAGTLKPWIAWGVGECFILDNGMEFHANAFKHVGWELSVDLEYCKVRTPWLKPKVERFFANLDHMSLTNGRVYKPTPNVLNIDPKKDAAITLSRLCKGLVQFVVDIHSFTPNSRTLALPFDLYSESMAAYPAPQLPLTMKGLDMIAAMSKRMTIAQGGVDFHGLSYAGYDLKELLTSARGKFTTLVKWDPDNLAEMYVQHSRTQEWVTLHCTRADYSAGLSWNQHRLLRQHVRGQLKASGNVDHLIAAKLQLSETWMEPLAKKNVSLEYGNAKKYGQLMAGASTYEDYPTDSVREPKRIVAQEELILDDREVPDFQTVSMY